MEATGHGNVLIFSFFLLFFFFYYFFTNSTLQQVLRQFISLAWKLNLGEDGSGYLGKALLIFSSFFFILLILYSFYFFFFNVFVNFVGFRAFGNSSCLDLGELEKTGN